MRTELAFEFLNLDLQTTRTNDVVFTTENTKFGFIR